MYRFRYQDYRNIKKHSISLASLSLFICIHKDSNAKAIQCCCKTLKCAREEILGKFLCFSMSAEKQGHDENIFDLISTVIVIVLAT